MAVSGEEAKKTEVEKENAAKKAEDLKKAAADVASAEPVAPKIGPLKDAPPIDEKPKRDDASLEASGKESKPADNPNPNRSSYEVSWREVGKSLSNIAMSPFEDKPWERIAQAWNAFKISDKNPRFSSRMRTALNILSSPFRLAMAIALTPIILVANPIINFIAPFLQKKKPNDEAEKKEQEMEMKNPVSERPKHDSGEELENKIKGEESQVLEKSNDSTEIDVSMSEAEREDSELGKSIVLEDAPARELKVEDISGPQSGSETPSGSSAVSEEQGKLDSEYKVVAREQHGDKPPMTPAYDVETKKSLEESVKSGVDLKITEAPAAEEPAAEGGDGGYRSKRRRSL